MSIRTFLLIILIAILGAFIYLKVQVLGDSGSSFNKTTRYNLGRHPVYRNILGMHEDGGARAEYLIGTSPVVVEIVQASNTQLPDKVVKSFVDQVQGVTGRPVSLFNIDNFQSGTLSDSDLATIVKTKRRQTGTGQPNLFIVYAQDFTSKTNEVGHTIQEFGIVLSDQRLKELTKFAPSTLPDYQLSTLLHEFGHQIGLGHNAQESCIMNAEVEMPTAPLPFSGVSTPTEFCSYELDQLKEIKNYFK